MHLFEALGHRLGRNHGLNELTSRLEKAEVDYKKFESLVKKGQETRGLFQEIGGENITLITSDNISLGATFLSAKAFKQKLKDNGGKFVTLMKEDEGKKHEIQGISFKLSDIENNEKNIINTLTELTALTNLTPGKIKLGSGWTKIADGENIILIRNENLTKFINQKDTSKEFIKLKPDSPEFELVNGVKREYSEINPDTHGGTIIISSGIDGVYEQHKVEAMAFLFKGMNVMMANFRGYGHSEGIPSKKGFHRDLEAAYEYVKERTHDPDNKILLRGVCLSGGAAAYLAAKHPEMNIFLDQTYSNFQTLVQQQLKEAIESYANDLKVEIKFQDKHALKDMFLKWASENFSTILAKVGSMMAPSFDVSSNLSSNKGKKAILFVYDDEVVSFDHVEKNIQALAQNNNMEYLTLFSSPGTHGTYWPHIYTQPYQYEEEGKNIRSLRNEARDKKNTIEQELAQLEYLKSIRTISVQGQDVQAKINNLQTQIEEIDRKTNEKISEITDTIQEDQMLGSYVGLAIIDSFLFKAHLSDDIIKSPFQLKREINPMMKKIEKTTQMIEHQQKENESILEIFKEIHDSRIMRLKVDKEFHVLTIPFSKNQFKEVKISNKDIERLVHSYEQLKILNQKIDELSEYGISDVTSKNTNLITKLHEMLHKQYEINNNKFMEKFVKKFKNIEQEVKLTLESLDSTKKAVGNKIEELLQLNMKQLPKELNEIDKTKEIIQKIDEYQEKLNELEEALEKRAELTPSFSFYQEQAETQLLELSKFLFKATHTAKYLLSEQDKIYNELREFTNKINKVEVDTEKLDIEIQKIETELFNSESLIDLSSLIDEIMDKVLKVDDLFREGKAQSVEVSNLTFVPEQEINYIQKYQENKLLVGEKLKNLKRRINDINSQLLA